MFSFIKQTFGIYTDDSQSSADTTSAVQYTDSGTEVKTSPEVETSPEVKTYSVVDTSPEVKTSPEVNTFSVVKTSPEVKTYSVVETSPEVKTSPEVNTFSVVKTSPEVKTFSVVKTSPEVKTYSVVKTSPEVKTYSVVKTSPEAKTSPEIEVSTSDVNISTNGTIPENQSKGRTKSQAPQISTVTDPTYKVTTAVFCTLWMLTMTSLALGVVFYYREMSVLQIEIDNLRINVTSLIGLEKIKVAFAASLKKQMQVTVGPYKEFRILVYENVFTNVGKAYDNATGMFTAPLKGVYQFSFTAFGWSTNIPTAADLYKNGVYMTGAYDNNPGPGRGTALSVALEMEVGDVVYLGLAKGMRVHDNTNNYNVFSGHLLFPL